MAKRIVLFAIVAALVLGAAYAWAQVSRVSGSTPAGLPTTIVRVGERTAVAHVLSPATPTPTPTPVPAEEQSRLSLEDEER